MFRKVQLAGASGLVLVASLFMGVDTVAAGSPSVPFYLSIAGVGGFSSPASVYFRGSGTAWHMGEITDNGDATDFTPATTCPQGGINNLHSETFRAADGSTLSVLSHDVACWVSPTRIYCADCPWSVTAGTGRFADASGTGELNGYLDLATGTFAGTYTGTIRY